MRPLIIRRSREATIPVLEDVANRSPCGDQFRDLRVHGGEDAVGCRAHVAAGPAATGTNMQEGRELAEREAEPQAVANQLHSLDDRRRVLPVAGGRSCRRGKKAEPLVVPDRVGADARAAGQFADAKWNVHDPS